MSSGDTLMIWTPLHNEPPTSENATLDTRNSHPLLRFLGTASNSAIFSGVMPETLSASPVGISTHIWWAATSSATTTGNWRVRYERMPTTATFSVDTDGFGNYTSATASVLPTIGALIQTTITTTSTTDLDQVARGDGFRFTLNRNKANDTTTTSLEVYAIELRET